LDTTWEQAKFVHNDQSSKVASPEAIAEEWAQFPGESPAKPPKTPFETSPE
jgi:hypothetical protein